MASLARADAIERVTVADVRVVSVETSTPRARTFVAALLESEARYSLTSREVRAFHIRRPFLESPLG